MPNFNKERIFNESPKKVLIREYDKLKTDYNRLNALKYKQLYCNASLSFILENSAYIYKEMYCGADFIIDIFNRFPLPYQLMERISYNILDYVNNIEKNENISEEQKEKLSELSGQIDKHVCAELNSIRLYNQMMEHSEFLNPYYDDAYKYLNNGDNIALESLKNWLHNPNNMYLMDVIKISINIPELHPDLYVYLKERYNDNSDTEEKCRVNTLMINTVSRMLTDSYFIDKIQNISNTNLRYALLSIGNVEEADEIKKTLVIEKASDDYIYSTAENAVNYVYDNKVYEEIFREENNKEKLNRLLCEKAIVDTSLSFLLMDNFSNDDAIRRNSIVETVCIESGNISDIPKDIITQIEILENVSKNLQKSIDEIITEKYFKPDGSVGDVVGNKIGKALSDDMFSQKKKVDDKKEKNDDDNEDNDNDDKEEDYYTPTHVPKASNISDSNKKQTDKYANASLDTDEFNSLFDESFMEKKDEDPDDISEAIKNARPDKKNIFRRIQNKALDANVKFKKTVANGKRNFVDVKNAGKAVVKIPNNVSASVKKQIEEWDELDDNKRKEYISRPGFRKKYFKALKIVISHYVAFLINPVLNVVLLISQHFSKTKDERIKNELVRELKAEIKVTEEKIEDAKAKDDKEQKYKLMRIKEKLDAEVVRIGTNSKYV